MGWTHITVKQGDTLSQIARTNGTTVGAILQDNPHLTTGDGIRARDPNGDRIYEGDEIRIFNNKLQCRKGQGSGNSPWGCTYETRNGEIRFGTIPGGVGISWRPK